MPPRKRPAGKQSEYGRLLASHIRAIGLTKVEFSKRCKISPGFLAHILYGDAITPIKNLPMWMDVLQLEGSQRKHFYSEALISTCSDPVRELIRDLQRQITDKKKRKRTSTKR